MFGEDVVQIEPVGVTTDQAEEIALNNMAMIGLGSIGVMFLIYKYLIK